MKFLSLFSGVGGFDLGLERAGMECVGQVECDKNCSRVLEHHWLDVPRHDDVRTFDGSTYAIRPDVICGGFPCQDLSVAGRRAGLAGKRSGLFFEFMRIVADLAPTWVVIENVPGLLSSNGGRDMGVVLGALAELGYGFAYRILDAQWFGVAQRRRRVFIVGCAAGAWRRAARVLFERESLPWDTPPRREAWSRASRCIARGTGSSGYRYDANGEDFVTAFNWQSGGDVRLQPQVELSNTLQVEQTQAVAYQCHGTNVGPMGAVRSGNGNVTGGVPFTVGALACNTGPAGHDAGNFMSNQAVDAGYVVAVAENQRGELRESDIAPQLSCGGEKPGSGYEAVAFQTRIARNGRGQPKEITDALTSADGGTHADSKPHVAGAFGVRRLTTVECARLQGFPDEWLDCGLSNSAKYRALGNAVCVPVAEWLGRRLAIEADPQVPVRREPGRTIDKEPVSQDNTDAWKTPKTPTVTD